MFASRVTKDIELEGGYVVTIRKLSARSLEKANDAVQATVTTTAKNLGAELIKVFRETVKDEKEAKEKKPEDRYLRYDRFTVLTQGVSRWKGPGLTEGAPTPNQLEDLDEPSAAKLFHEIIDLSDPPQEKIEAAEKNASSLSTAS